MSSEKDLGITKPNPWIRILSSKKKKKKLEEMI